MTPATIGFNLLPVCCKSGSAFACNHMQQSHAAIKMFFVICYSTRGTESTILHQLLLIDGKTTHPHSEWSKRHVRSTCTVAQGCQLCFWAVNDAAVHCIALH